MPAKAAEKILTPLIVTEAWDQAAVNHFLNETVINTGEDWYNQNPYRRASNLIRLVIYLRAHPSPSVFWEVPTASLRIRNVLRSFWRQERIQTKDRRIGSLTFGRTIFEWADRLDGYLSTRSWVQRRFFSRYKPQTETPTYGCC